MTQSATTTPLFSLRQNLRRFFIAPPQQNAALDGFRALSILYVVIFHAFYLPHPAFAQLGGFVEFVQGMPAWLNWVWHGDNGVDMFFILSGFLIASLLLREREQRGTVRVGRFYQHRALRILPVYVFALLLAMVPANSHRESVWANLLFVNNFLPIDKVLIPWSWSLSIEVQFYLLFPLLFVLLSRSRRPIAWLVGLFLAATAVRYGVIGLYPELYQHAFFYHAIATDTRPVLMFEKLYINLYTRAGPLLLGVLLAYTHHLHGAALQSWLQRHRWAASGLGVAALALVAAVTSVAVFDPARLRSEAFNAHYLAWYRNLFALGVATVLLLSLYGVGIGRVFHAVLAQRFWYPVAQSAYATYLFHIPFIAVGYVVVLHGQTEQLQRLALGEVLLAAGLGWLLSFVFSLLVYLFIERPFMNIYKRSGAR